MAASACAVVLAAGLTACTPGDSAGSAVGGVFSSAPTSEQLLNSGLDAARQKVAEKADEWGIDPNQCEYMVFGAKFIAPQQIADTNGSVQTVGDPVSCVTTLVKLKDGSGNVVNLKDRVDEDSHFALANVTFDAASGKLQSSDVFVSYSTNKSDKLFQRSSSLPSIDKIKAEAERYFWLVVKDRQIGSDGEVDLDKSTIIVNEDCYYEYCDYAIDDSEYFIQCIIKAELRNSNGDSVYVRGQNGQKESTFTYCMYMDHNCNITHEKEWDPDNNGRPW